MRGELAERRDRGSIAALFGEVGHERRDEIALADRIENVRSVQQFARDAVRRFRRRVAQRDLAEAKPGARQLAVIGGGIASSGLVLSTHLLELPDRLGGAAAPVGGTGTDDRIDRAFIDLREMRQARRPDRRESAARSSRP